MSKHLHPQLEKEIHAVSLFSGLGGGSLGLHSNFVKEDLAIDNWKVAQEVFEHNFTDELHIPFWLQDIETIDENEILRRIGMMPGQLDILLASPPCQGFSVAKANLSPLDKRNRLFLKTISLIAGVKPKVFIIENVPGMNDKRLVPIFNEIKFRLKEQLMDEYEIRCYKLETLNYATPQLRKRLLFIGYHKSLGAVPTVPPTDHESKEHLRIVDIVPEITAVKVGQSSKSIKHNTKVLNTVTATGGTTVFVNGEEQVMTAEHNRKFATFPDWYKLPNGITEKQAQKLFGNTIPPRFMQAVVAHILNQVGNKF